MKRKTPSLALAGIMCVLGCWTGLAVDPLDQWQWHLRMPLPTDNRLYGVAYGNGRFVAVGAQGTILVSEDGLAWTNHPIGLGNYLSSITYGNGTFLAIGSGGLVARSRDGLSWDLQYLHGLWFIGVSYGNGTFVAIALGPEGQVWKSSDGQLWTRTYLSTTHRLNAITYGSGVFVAVGEGVGAGVGMGFRGKVLTSPDAISWTEQQSGTRERLTGVQFGNGIFVAVGTAGTILTSPDGTEWSQVPREGPVWWHYMLVNFDSLAYANGLFIAGIASAGEKWVSSDGVVWSIGSVPGIVMGGLAYGQGMFVLVGTDGNVFTSLDGQSWTNRRDASYPITGIAYGNHTFVATAFDQALTSADGIKWTSHATGDPLKASGLTFAGNFFFSLATSGDFDWDTTNALLISADGTNWTRSMAWTNTATKIVFLSLPAYRAGKYVNVGNLSEWLSPSSVVLSGFSMTSPDGFTWTRHRIDTEDLLGPVAVHGDDGRFVAMGSFYGFSSDVFTSGDGITWRKAWSGPAQHVGSLVFGNHTFVAVADGQSFLVSEDALDWRTVKPDYDRGICQVAYGNGLFVASGMWGNILSSSDGIVWAVRNIGTYDWLCSIAYGNGTFVTGGQGYIYQSEAFSPTGVMLGPLQCLPSGTVQVVISGLQRRNWLLEGSSDLISWIPLASGQGTTESVQYTDTNAAGLRQRFYRAVIP
jgi:hypothetical protein